MVGLPLWKFSRIFKRELSLQRLLSRVKSRGSQFVSTGVTGNVASGPLEEVQVAWGHISLANSSHRQSSPRKGVFSNLHWAVMYSLEITPNLWCHPWTFPGSDWEKEPSLKGQTPLSAEEKLSWQLKTAKNPWESPDQVPWETRQWGWGVGTCNGIRPKTWMQSWLTQDKLPVWPWTSHVTPR